jgi:hypothetical protein
MKKLLLIFLALSVVFMMVAMASADDKADTVKGFVSDTKCGAKGNSEAHADCTKKCVAAGAKLAIVTDDGKVLTVDNGDALKGHEGHHVSVDGHVKGDSIHVEKVSML